MREERIVRVGRELSLAALGVPLEDLDSWVVDRLTSILDERDFRRGDTLMVAGEPVESLFFINDGAIRFTRDDGPSWTLRGRWFVGGFEALGDVPASHTATALGDFHCMSVPAMAWAELLEDSSQMSRLVVTNASRALTKLEARVPLGAPVSRSEPSLLAGLPAGELNLVERLALLLDSRMLRTAGVQALADLAAASREVSFAAGELLFARGAECEQVFRVVEGDVLAECADPIMSRQVRPGDIVCGAAILGRIAGAWEARAATPARAIAFPVEALFELMEEHFDLVRAMLNALAARRLLLLEHLAARSEDLVLA
jgi:CRP-like cAMP-binding protein